MEEKLKTLQDCAEFLNGMGFEESPFAYDYLNDELVSYTMKNKNNVNVVLTCHPSDKWDDRNTSDVYSVFEHPNDFGHLSISVTTDCLTGELVVSGFGDIDFYKATKEDIDKLFVERILTDKETNEPRLKFAYLLDDDEKYTIKTYGEVSQCLAISRDPLYYTMRHIDEISTDAIPEKYMHYYDEAKEAVLNISNKPKK